MDFRFTSISFFLLFPLHTRFNENMTGLLAPSRPEHSNPTFRSVAISKEHSITLTKQGKPSKLYPEFTLFPHASGQWAKKIKGRTVGVHIQRPRHAAVFRMERLASGSRWLL